MVFSLNKIGDKLQGKRQQCSLRTSLVSSYRGIENGVFSYHYWSQVTGGTDNSVLLEHH